MQHLAPPLKSSVNLTMWTSSLLDANRLAFTVHSTPNSVSAAVPSANNFAIGAVTKNRTDWQSYCAILASKVALQQENTTNNTSAVNNMTLNHLLPIDKILKPLTISDLPSAPNHGSTLRVAYELVPNAYGEFAAEKAYPDCEAIPCNESEIAFHYVEDRIVDRAVLPVENSITGSIHRNYDLLLRHRLHIVGELQLPFRNDSSNITRFVKLAREPIVPRTDRLFKTSIVFAQEDGASELFKVLSAFEFREIRLTHVECRPNRKRPVRVVEDVNGGMAKHFEYMFYVDFEGSMAEVRAQKAVAEVEEFTSFLRVLGSYPMDVGAWST